MRGVDIALYTFYGYMHAGATLLAKQVEQSDTSDPPAPATTSYVPRALRRQQLTKRAETLNIADFWAEVTEELKPAIGNTPEPLASGFNYRMPPLRFEGLSYGEAVHTYHSGCDG